MLDDELVKKNPLRRLDSQQQGLLPSGNLGLVVAPAGTGKTAFLVQLALDNLLRGEAVLHLSVAGKLQRIRSWYKELLLQLAGGQATAGLRRVEASMQSRQLIITFRKPAGLAARLSERLQQLDAQDIFQPTVVVVDGLGSGGELPGLLGQLAGIAAERNLSLWASLRQEAARPRNELPAELLAACAVVVYLEAAGPAVKLHLAKAPDLPSPPPPLLLDPQTLLLQQPPASPSRQ